MKSAGRDQGAGMEWIAARLQISPQVLEKISSALFALGAEGVQEEANGFTIYFPAEKWNAETFALLEQILSEASSAFRPDRLHVSALAAKDWNAAWKRYFKPFRAAKRLVVYPPWERYRPAGNERTIIINPKMGFGTGHHESTRLALELMEDFFSAGQSFLDIGTGSGILAIYAAMLGAKKIYANDIDEAALQNAAENSRLNNVEQMIRYFNGGPAAVPPGAFDFIAANINRRVLLELADSFSSFAKEGTRLALSGLLISDGAEVEDAFVRRGWRLKERRRMNEWQALMMAYE